MPFLVRHEQRDCFRWGLPQFTWSYYCIPRVVWLSLHTALPCVLLRLRLVNSGTNSTQHTSCSIVIVFCVADRLPPSRISHVLVTCLRLTSPSPAHASSWRWAADWCKLYHVRGNFLDNLGLIRMRWFASNLIILIWPDVWESCFRTVCRWGFRNDAELQYALRSREFSSIVFTRGPTYAVVSSFRDRDKVEHVRSLRLNFSAGERNLFIWRLIQVL